MKPILSRLLALLLAAALQAGCGAFAESAPRFVGGAGTAAEPVREETPFATLDRMSAFLASRPAVRVHAEVHYDAVQPSGRKIEFGSFRQVELEPPGRARFEVTHWDGVRELIVFGGDRLSASLPDHGVYASVEYEGDVASALDHVAEQYGVVTPLSELFRPDLAEEVRRRAQTARSLGTVWIDGFACDHLAFSSDDLDFQLFLRQGSEPVPHRLVVDYRGARGQPQFRAQLRDWSWPEALPPSRFRFAPPPGAQRVSFPELLDVVLGPIDEQP